VILLKPTVISRDYNGRGTSRSRASVFGATEARWSPARPTGPDDLPFPFGLREPPFGITPDTSFFYACASSQKR